MRARSSHTCADVVTLTAAWRSKRRTQHKGNYLAESDSSFSCSPEDSFLVRDAFTASAEVVTTLMPTGYEDRGTRTDEGRCWKEKVFHLYFTKWVIHTRTLRGPAEGAA